MQKLDTKQINNLITGNSLAAEIQATADNMRAFVVIRAYVFRGKEKSGGRVSRVLNGKDKKDIRFWLRKYEIEKKYVEDEWYYGSDDELVNSIYLEDIMGINQLETELSKYLDDFSILDVEWKCDNPV